ncbi:MAG: hypothetical protein A2V65_04355 [Deltaproteobacteria bacterium RBG_13_49_15]|nr:MAG: hypothetical protein A2V65_04355 [Deltaproteobacteria bacterium RBG_13_49_15]
MTGSDKRKNGNGFGKIEDELNGGLLNEVDESLDQVQHQLSDLQSQLQSPSEKLAKLVAKQKELCRNLNEDINKTRRIAYSALGLAVLALIVTGVIGAISLKLQSDVKKLHHTISVLGNEMITLKQDQEPSALTQAVEPANGSGEQIAAMKARLDELQHQQEEILKRFMTLEAPVKSKSTKISKPAADMPKVWSVNFASFRKEGYAKRKAAEFSLNGFPVQIKRVQVKDEIWHRLYATGFNTKEEASTYAERADRALNLGSVWVSVN